MITNLDVVRNHVFLHDHLSSPNATTLSLPMTGESSPYEIKEITGLTPSDLSYSTRSIPRSSSNVFSGTKHDVRQIIITTAFNERYGSIYELRTNLYEYFMTGYVVRLTFTVSGSKYYIDGIVKSHESNVFTNTPMSQITIECEFPYFRAIEDGTRTLTPNSYNYSMAITYPGTIPTGFKLRWNDNEDRTSPNRVHRFSLDNPRDGSMIEIRKDLDRYSTRYLFMSSISEEKAIGLASGSDTNLITLIGYLEEGYSWVHLVPGSQFLTIRFRNSSGGIITVNGSLEIEYPILMGGL